MSYGFGIFFKQVNSEAEAMKFGLEVTNNICKNAYERLQDAKYFIPSHQNFCEPENKKADEEWLYSCFTNCFTYWPEYQLLGMLETRIPHETIKMFDLCVYFQNSTDQNYDYERWKGISSFEEVVESVSDMSKEEILTFTASRWGYEEEDEEQMKELKEEIEKNEDYYRKSAVYQKIFEKLDLDTWMDDRSTSDEFIRFNFCAINGGDTHFELRMLLRAIKEECKKEMEE